MVYGKGKVEYYLFHVAPIYNWLRHVGSGMLAQYINKVDDKGKMNNPIKTNVNNNNLTSNYTNKNSNHATYVPFSNETWKF